MLTGVWPIATRTGHAEDVIRQGENGFLYEVDDHAAFDEALARSLDLYAKRRDDVRASVLPLTWERFGRGVDARVVESLGERVAA
jgi:glycosyltransferase involved in cell wall biosynthesis